MIRSNVTHAEALRRLVAEAKLLDADEVGERWNQLGGVLAVAEGVLRDGAPEVEYAVAHTELAHKIITFFGRATSPSMEPGADPFADRLAEKLASWIGDIPAAPVAAQPVGTVPQPIYERKRTAHGGGWVETTIDGYNEQADWNRRIIYLTAPVAGSAAPSGKLVAEVVDNGGKLFCMLMDWDLLPVGTKVYLGAAPSGEVERDAAELKLLEAAKAFAKEHIDGDALHEDASVPDDVVEASDERYNETKRQLCDAYIELTIAAITATKDTP